MARGRYYTEDEDSRLKRLAKDMQGVNPNVRWTEIADKAIDYGICPDRPRKPLADHIEKVMAEPVAKPAVDTMPVQEDLGSIMARAVLKTRIVALMLWLKAADPESYRDAIEKLEGER